MDHFISMYIDNELSLDEKILFLEHSFNNRTYIDDAISLIKQEKSLSEALNPPALEISRPNLPRLRYFPSLGLAAAACFLLIFSFLAGMNYTLQEDQTLQHASMTPETVQHRFVIHQLDTEQVEITGSFTDWQRVQLVPTGSEGYWEITLQVPSGEHRYSFIVDGAKLLPDPTVASQESDDFGSINSILKVEA